MVATHHSTISRNSYSAYFDNTTKRNKSHKLLKNKRNYANIDMCEPHLKESSRDKHERRFSYSRRYRQNPQDVRGDCQKIAAQKADARIQDRWNLESGTGRLCKVSRTAEKYSGQIKLKAAFSRRHFKNVEATVHIVFIDWYPLNTMLDPHCLYADSSLDWAKSQEQPIKHTGGGRKCIAMKRKFNPFRFKAIETKYGNYHYRSRLEARWAVFFDTLDISYYYEHEGFDLEGTWYLPDFWLPSLNCFVEIKPTEPTEEEMHKAKMLSIGAQKDVYLIAGNVHPGQYQIHVFFAPILQAYKPDQYSKWAGHKTIHTTSQVLYLLQQLKEARLEAFAVYSRVEIRPAGDFSGLVGFNIPEMIQQIQKQHDTLEKIAPHLEEYQDDLNKALTLEEGWYIDLSEGGHFTGLEWLECKNCHEFEMADLDVMEEHFQCKSTPHGELTKNSPRLEAAYKAALQARF